METDFHSGQKARCSGWRGGEGGDLNSHDIFQVPFMRLMDMLIHTLSFSLPFSLTLHIIHMHIFQNNHSHSILLL